MRIILPVALLAVMWPLTADAQWPRRGGPPGAAPDALTVPDTFANGQLVAPLARVTIFVRDMDRSLTLYRDILKLRVVHDATVEGQTVRDFLKSDGRALRTVILSPSDTTVGNVGLYQIVGAGADAGPAARDNFAHTGDFALVFTTNAIWDIYNEARAAGFAMMNPPVTLMSRPNMKQQPLEMSFRDPDGLMVNITQAGVPE